MQSIFEVPEDGFETATKNGCYKLVGGTSLQSQSPSSSVLQQIVASPNGAALRKMARLEAQQLEDSETAKINSLASPKLSYILRDRPGGLQRSTPFHHQKQLSHHLEA